MTTIQINDEDYVVFSGKGYLAYKRGDDKNDWKIEYAYLPTVLCADSYGWVYDFGNMNEGKKIHASKVSIADVVDLDLLVGLLDMTDDDPYDIIQRLMVLDFPMTVDAASLLATVWEKVVSSKQLSEKRSEAFTRAFKLINEHYDLNLE